MTEMILGEHLDQATPETAPRTFWLNEPVCPSFPAYASWNQISQDLRCPALHALELGRTSKELQSPPIWFAGKLRAESQT